MSTLVDASQKGLAHSIVDAIIGYSTVPSEYLKAKIASYLSTQDTLVALAFFLVIVFLFDILCMLWPRARSFIFTRQIAKAIGLVKLLFFLIIFYQLDSGADRTLTHKVAFSLFIIITIALILFVLWRGAICVMMFVRYKNIKIAIASPRAIIMDGSVYPVDCFEPVIVVTREINHGTEEVRFGEHCLFDVPKNIAYRSILKAYDYTYHSTAKWGTMSAYIFKVDKTSDASL